MAIVGPPSESYQRANILSQTNKSTDNIGLGTQSSFTDSKRLTDERKLKQYLRLNHIQTGSIQLVSARLAANTRLSILVDSLKQHITSLVDLKRIRWSMAENHDEKKMILLDDNQHNHSMALQAPKIEKKLIPNKSQEKLASKASGGKASTRKARSQKEKASSSASKSKQYKKTATPSVTSVAGSKNLLDKKQSKNSKALTEQTKNIISVQAQIKKIIPEKNSANTNRQWFYDALKTLSLKHNPKASLQDVLPSFKKSNHPSV